MFFKIRDKNSDFSSNAKDLFCDQTEKYMVFDFIYT